MFAVMFSCIIHDVTNLQSADSLYSGLERARESYHAASRCVCSAMNVFTDRQLRRRSGMLVSSDEALQSKVVALYFSAGWCPPCQHFTPLLKEFYIELKEDEKPFEIVFVSSDKTASDMETYMKQSHGDWLAVPFGNEMIKQLKSRYHVTAIPKLIVVTDDGDVVTAVGRKEVTEQGPTCFTHWAHAVTMARGNLTTTKVSGQLVGGDE